MMKKEGAMKTTLIKTIAALIGATATSAYASNANAASEGSGMLTWFLIGFGVMVIMLQAIPALVVFASMIKGLFGNRSETEARLPEA